MILTTGCSFTYGEELPNPSTQAWPHILSDKINTPVNNLGMNGASNDYIQRTTMEAVLQHKYDMVIVQWTEISRVELHANISVTLPPRYTNHTGTMQVSANGIGRGVPSIDDYYKNWWDEKFAFQKWIWQVIAMQNLLENHDVTYHMVNAFGNQQLIKKYDLAEYAYINTERFIGWPGEGMVEWSYGTPNMPNGHPGPEGHKRIAEKIWPC